MSTLSDLVELPPGVFRMGSQQFYPDEGPVHAEQVDAFAIDMLEEHERGTANGIMWSIFFELASVSYNAVLRQVSTPATMGRVSGFGWAMGYFGGIVLLLGVYLGFITGDGPTTRASRVPCRTISLFTCIRLIGSTTLSTNRSCTSAAVVSVRGARQEHSGSTGSENVSVST